MNQLSLTPSRLKNGWLRFDQFFERQRTLILLLALALFLRLPSFYEPLIYFDEAIYLAIGQALKTGAVLYRDLFDHKPPLIYYLASGAGSLWAFRLLATLANLTSLVVFWLIGQRLKFKKPILIVVSLLFVLMTSLPLFEGLITNAELLGAPLILLAVWLTLKALNLDASPQSKLEKSTKWSLGWAGICFGLACLIKAPFALDFLAILIASQLIWSGKTKPRRLSPALPWLSLGFLVPILLSLLWFTRLGALGDYFSANLNYNLHYLQIWRDSFHWLLPLFTSLPGKIFVLLSFVLLASLGQFRTSSRLPASFLLLFLWAGFSLVAATLSGRPYTHYLLQPLAPLLLLLGFTLTTGRKDQLPIRTTPQSRKYLFALTALLLLLALHLTFSLGWWAMRRPTLSYYQNWVQLISHQQDYAHYASRLHWLTLDNSQSASLITANQASTLFIWGDNPMLYALTKTRPVGPYLAQFYFAQDHQLVEKILAQVIKAKPTWILTMNETPTPPTLDRFLNNYYYPRLELATQQLWRLRSPAEEELK